MRRVVIAKTATLAGEDLTTEQLEEKIKELIKKRFPNCFYASKFHPSQYGASLYIQFALGADKTKWANGIIHNDPAYNTFWVRGMNDDGIPQKGYILEAAQIGLYKDRKSDKLGWRDVKKPSESKAIIKAFEKYFNGLRLLAQGE